MMMRLRRRRRCLSIQEIILSLLFQEVSWALRIIPLHLKPLLRRELRQVANEVDKLPTIFLRAVWTRKRRHSREPHAIFDNPKKFAIRELLRFRQPQVRRLGIKSAAHHRVATAVIAMADGAMVREVQHSSAQIFFGGRHGIRKRSRLARKRHVPGFARHHHFDRRGCRLRTHTVMQQRIGQETNRQHRNAQQDKDKSSAFLHSLVMLDDQSLSALAPNCKSFSKRLALSAARLALPLVGYAVA